MIHRIALPILLLMSFTHAHAADQRPQRLAIRVMTMNAGDISSTDLTDAENPRLQQLAEIIQRVRPNILFLNEIAFDPEGSNASRFVEHYLAVPQAPDLKPIEFASVMFQSNTGIPSGHDLDHDGHTAAEPPAPQPSDALGRPARQTPEGRAYGNDCFGFGTYPGQYAFALLVDPTFEIDLEHIRSFQHFLWKDLPGAEPPTNPDGSPFYTPQAWDTFRLSSKNFADIPIRPAPDADPIHFLLSHPTPPAFDGPEKRNKHRNRDEIRLLRAYIDNNQALVDDQGTAGGLESDAHFVIMGDLNADPIDGSSLGSPIADLLNSPRLAPDNAPRSTLHVEGLDPTDTSLFRLRVDYVLPSATLETLRAGIWRHGHDRPGGFPSDHFPVWAELAIPTDPQ